MHSNTAAELWGGTGETASRVNAREDGLNGNTNKNELPFALFVFANHTALFAFFFVYFLNLAGTVFFFTAKISCHKFHAHCTVCISRFRLGVFALAHVGTKRGRRFVLPPRPPF